VPVSGSLLPAATSARTSARTSPASRTCHGALLGRMQRHGAPRGDGVAAGRNGTSADGRVGLSQ